MNSTSTAKSPSVKLVHEITHVWITFDELFCDILKGGFDIGALVGRYTNLDRIHSRLNFIHFLNY